jgi:hypothetical protein
VEYDDPLTTSLSEIDVLQKGQAIAKSMMEYLQSIGILCTCVRHNKFQEMRLTALESIHSRSISSINGD